MNRLAQDLRLALRALRRTPTFTTTAVLILGIAIGMAVAMYSVFQAVLVRALPVHDQDRLVVMWTYRDPGVEASILSSHLEPLRHESRTMRGIAGVVHWGAAPSPLIDGDHQVVLARSLVTGNFFNVLGARPVAGRLLRPEDDAPGAAHVMVLSYAAWQRQYVGDPAVIGHHVTEPYSRWDYTIVGVAPPGLDHPAGVGYWVPIWGIQTVRVVARLVPGATPATARTELFAIASRIAPEWHFRGAAATTFPLAVVGDVRPVLVILTAAVGLLLLIACVNVGNLLLLRAASRERELAIRRALGASYGNVLRQLIAESAVLAAAGGALGLACAQAALAALLAFAPERLPRTDVIRLAGAPAGAALGVTIVAVLLFGVLPALAAARGGLASPLRLDARSGSDTRTRRRVRQWLVASQVALALIMLAGAGLLARSLERLERLQLGYAPEHLSVLSVTFPGPRYDSLPKLLVLGDRVLARWRAIPGVRALTPLLLPPFLGANVFQGRVDVEGQTPAQIDADPSVPLEVGGPEYFQALGIPLRRGRGFEEADRETGPQVAVVSEAIARRFWPDADPIGKRIRFWSADSLTWRTVVGVAGDIHYRTLREATPTVYLPWRQAYWQGSFALRSSGDLASLLPALRRELRAVDPQVEVWDARTMDDLLAGPLSEPRLGAFLLSAFGIVALLLAAIGLYGVMASAVRAETREIGVRMALGATTGRVRRHVLGRALIVTSAGSLVGVAGALASSRLFTKLLFQVSPTDPLTLAGVCVVLMAVGLAAAYLPARRATRVDPAQALRAD